jgi:hypothetical protein
MTPRFGPVEKSLFFLNVRQRRFHSGKHHDPRVVVVNLPESVYDS